MVASCSAMNFPNSAAGLQRMPNGPAFMKSLYSLLLTTLASAFSRVATIAAGATHLPLGPFLVVSFVGRAGRFFLVAATLRLFGARIRTTLERNFDLAALAFFVLLVGGFAALKLL